MKRDSGVFYQNMREFDRAIDQGSDRTVGKCLSDELMSVHRFTLERDEQVTGTHIARIHLDARYLELVSGAATGCFGNLSCSPQRQRQLIALADWPRPQGCMRHHAATPSAAHWRATSTSSNGKTRISSPDPII